VIDEGDVWWVRFAGEGSEADGRRPAVVVDCGLYETLQTRVVVPCSANLDRIGQPTATVVPAAPTGLPADSVALCHLCTAVDRGAFEGTGPIGTVPDVVLSEIRVVLAELLGIGADTFL